MIVLRPESVMRSKTTLIVMENKTLNMGSIEDMVTIVMLDLVSVEATSIRDAAVIVRMYLEETNVSNNTKIGEVMNVTPKSDVRIAVAIIE